MSQSSAQTFQSALERRVRAVETLLAALLDERPRGGEILRPPRLLAAMRHGVLNGGKRLRPFLVLESAALFQADGEAALRVAASLECVHCYSLIHDDLPAMDDDDLRRGQPTVHRAFDEATAILAGDGLLTCAFDVLADPATHADPAVRADLVLGLARGAGLGGMVGGQALDLEAEKKTEPHAPPFVMTMQAMKTGALLLHAIDAGARIGGANAGQRAALDRYGRALGACFQVADDILDAEGDEAALGKRAGKDAGRNKATLVAALGLEAARTRRDTLAIEAIEALTAGDFGARADVLAEAARFTAARRS